LKRIDKNKPLPKHTKIDYHECYAKIILEKMFPETFCDLVILDKPDLQNNQLNIGVEITSSGNYKQREAQALYEKWHEQDTKGKEKIEKQIKKCGAKLNKGILEGISDNDNFERIYKVLENKMKKFNLMITNFLRNNIYLFSQRYLQLLQ